MASVADTARTARMAGMSRVARVARVAGVAGVARGMAGMIGMARVAGMSRGMAGMPSMASMIPRHFSALASRCGYLPACHDQIDICASHAHHLRCTCCALPLLHRLPCSPAALVTLAGIATG
jgi:hypothetical protein